MKNNKKRNRRYVFGVEGLESRALLSADLTALSAAAGRISGVVSGANTYTDEDSGVDRYNLSGKVRGATATLVGGDDFSSTQINKRTERDTYTDGDVTLSIGGATATMAYSGHGTSPASDRGPFSATFHGTALFTSGPNAGQTYRFDATLNGREQGGTFAHVTEKFTLKP